MTNPQPSCDERIANRITENMATASPSATKAMILEALQAKQKTIDDTCLALDKMTDKYFQEEQKLRKTNESLRAEVELSKEDVKRYKEELIRVNHERFVENALLSRLREALEKIIDLNQLEARKLMSEQRPFSLLTKIMSICDEALTAPKESPNE